MSDSFDDPGDFIGFPEWSDGEKEGGPRVGLSVSKTRDCLRSVSMANSSQGYDLHVNWGDLSESIKYAIIREVSRVMPFYDAISFLQLEDSEIREFIALLEREVALHSAEEERIEASNARQIELVISVGSQQARDEMEAFFEREAKEPHPTLFYLNKDDAKQAALFLEDFRSREEFPDYDPETTPQHILDDMKAIPSSVTLKATIVRVRDYGGADPINIDLEFAAEVLEMYDDAAALIEEYTGSDSGDEQEDLDDSQPQEFEQPDEFEDVWQPKQYENLAGLRKHASQPQEYEEQDEFEQDDDFEEFEPAPKKKKKTAVKSPAKKSQKKAPKKASQPKKVTKGPSRLREVINADDFETPPPESPLMSGAIMKNATAMTRGSAHPVEGFAPEMSTAKQLSSLGGDYSQENSPSRSPSPDQALGGRGKQYLQTPTTTSDIPDSKQSTSANKPTISGQSADKAVAPKVKLFLKEDKSDPTQAPASHLGEPISPSPTSTKATEDAEKPVRSPDQQQKPGSSIKHWVKNGLSTAKSAVASALAGSKSPTPKPATTDQLNSSEAAEKPGSGKKQDAGFAAEEAKKEKSDIQKEAGKTASAGQPSPSEVIQKPGSGGKQDSPVASTQQKSDIKKNTSAPTSPKRVRDKMSNDVLEAPVGKKQKKSK